MSDFLILSSHVVWLTKDRATVGPVFGSADRFEGLGIFFDTYDNERAHVSLVLHPTCPLCIDATMLHSAIPSLMCQA